MTGGAYPLKKENHKAETSTLKKARLLQSAPFLSGRIELTPLPSLSSLPCPSCFHRDLPPWFIWWKEFCAGPWLWWYPYTVTFSPRQMFVSQNTVTFIPKSPYKRIKWSQHVLRARRPIGVTGTATWRLGDWRSGKDNKEERSRQTEWPMRQTVEGVGHMLTPADDIRMTWRSKGRSGAETGCETPTNAVMVDTLEFSSLPGSARLSWFIVSYHFTRNITFICFFWSSAELSNDGERWVLKKTKNKK